MVYTHYTLQITQLHFTLYLEHGQQMCLVCNSGLGIARKFNNIKALKCKPFLINAKILLCFINFRQYYDQKNIFLFVITKCRSNNAAHVKRRKNNCAYYDNVHLKKCKSISNDSKKHHQVKSSSSMYSYLCSIKWSLCLLNPDFF